ncbi:Actin associated protein Wsp1, partial [Rasamsonia emersonii CBS 393.64]
MPSILSDADKETVKRTVPKPANKILAVAVARLYVAHPDPTRWTYTGLQGAAVLANDLIGHTFWIKLVDVSPAGRGVIWDQEIYDGFSYNQDRTFFHTFELEECPAALSFADEKEAKTFIKKMHEREKHASKETKQTPFACTRGQGPAPTTNGKAPGRSLFGSLLHPNRGSTPTPPPAPAPAAPPAQKSALDDADPSIQGILDELREMGITEEQIRENQDFIKSYIEQKQADGVDGVAATPSPPVEDQRKGKAPPPPPPSAPPAPKTTSISPQHTGSSSSGRRGPPPPPPARRGRADASPGPQEPEPAREPSPPRPKFRAPPPIADAGKYAHTVGPIPPARPRAASGSTPGPPPPPRPPKAPLDDSASSRSGAPPVPGERKVSAPPAPPSRSPSHAPPPPPP